jgi:hypothetical protein
MTVTVIIVLNLASVHPKHLLHSFTAKPDTSGGAGPLHVQVFEYLYRFSVTVPCDRDSQVPNTSIPTMHNSDHVRSGESLLNIEKR